MSFRLILFNFVLILVYHQLSNLQRKNFIGDKERNNDCVDNSLICLRMTKSSNQYLSSDTETEKRVCTVFIARARRITQETRLFGNFFSDVLKIIAVA